MTNKANVVGLEILVLRLNDAVDVCVEAFGWDLVFRGPSGDVAGERAVLDAGSITVTLLEAADSGPNLLSDRTPRLTQLVVGGDEAEMAATTDQLTALGMATISSGAGRRFIPPEAMAGVFGFEAAITLQPIELGDELDEAPPE